MKKEADPFGDFVKFQGFDANNDDHYGVMSYLVQDLGRYEEQNKNGGILNSHSRGSLTTYQRMLAAYRPMVEGSSSLESLTADQLIEILKRPGRRV